MPQHHLLDFPLPQERPNPTLVFQRQKPRMAVLLLRQLFLAYGQRAYFLGGPLTCASSRRPFPRPVLYVVTALQLIF